MFSEIKALDFAEGAALTLAWFNPLRLENAVKIASVVDKTFLELSNLIIKPTPLKNILCYYYIT